jgi:TonB family protein
MMIEASARATFRRMTSHSLGMLALTMVGCQHLASSARSSADASHSAPRLSHAEQVIVPPEYADWPRQVSTGEFPHYPPGARGAGVEARVIMAFVVDEGGRVEPGTISILQPAPAHRDFESSVCMFLRTNARFSWVPHSPARGLVVLPFEFTLSGGSDVFAEALPPMPDLRAVKDSLRLMLPPQLAAWVESKQHCF